MEDYLDAQDASDAELEELVLDSYLGGLSFAIDPQVIGEAAFKENRQTDRDTPEGSEDLLHAPNGTHAQTAAAPSATISLKPRLHRRLLHKLLGPEGILLRDKLAFVLGSTLLWVCAFTLGRSPQTFYRLYTGLGVALMVVRYVTYRRSKRHYYLFDICYFANLLLVTHVWLLRDSALLQTVTFAFDAGPVMWSIVAFRNSCVYHDLDKVTSLYLHLVPAMVSWTLRWYPTKAFYGFPSHEIVGPDRTTKSRGTLVSLVLVPALFYSAWAIAYYLKIFVISASKIKERGYITLFSFVTTQRKGVFHAIAKRVRPSLQPPVYFALHLLFCLTTFCISIAAWHSFYVHTLLLLLCASMSIWHGAQYYFEVFAGRYAEGLRRTFSGVPGSQLDDTKTAPPAQHEKVL